MLSELLSGKRNGTTYLPEIHKVLSLPAPAGPLMSKDEEEMLGVARTLTRDQWSRLMERAQTFAEENKKKRN